MIWRRRSPPVRLTLVWHRKLTRNKFRLINRKVLRLNRVRALFPPFVSNVLVLIVKILILIRRLIIIRLSVLPLLILSVVNRFIRTRVRRIRMRVRMMILSVAWKIVLLRVLLLVYNGTSWRLVTLRRKAMNSLLLVSINRRRLVRRNRAWNRTVNGLRRSND